MNISTGKISDIIVDEKETWEKVFLTIDIDWACDEVLLDTLHIIENADICATWFVTHDTPVLERLRSNPKFELGIHPNFNFLLNGDKRNGVNAEDVVARLLKIIPEATTIRSHSTTQSSPLLSLFRSMGLRYDCNHFIPEQTRIELKPWLLWDGLIRVPYFWEDDIFCIYDSNSSIETLVLERKGVKVFDFHPIHIFLNTDSLILYEKTKEIHHSPRELIRHRAFSKEGSRELLFRLLGTL